MGKYHCISSFVPDQESGNTIVSTVTNLQKEMKRFRQEITLHQLLEKFQMEYPNIPET